MGFSARKSANRGRAINWPCDRRLKRHANRAKICGLNLGHAKGCGVSLAKNQVHQGDCVELLAKLKKESVDLVFADPPFNIGYDYDVYDDQRNSGDYLEWCREWIQGVHRCLKPDGTFWLAIGDEYAAELKIESQKIGFHCRSWVIWYYTFGVNCRNGFSRSHTHLFHFVKDPKQFTFNRLNPQVRVKSARQLVYADNRANPNGRLPDNTWITRPQDAPESFSPNHDTWYFARVAGTFKEREGFHGCQMPEQLLARILRVSSNPADFVVDPFGGSGTTLGVAKKLGRQFMGFELSADYVAYIHERLGRIRLDDPIDGPRDPIRSAPSTARGKQRKTRVLDRATELAVIQAFQSVCDGFPVNYFLCDQERVRAFLKECKANGVDWNSTQINGLLMQLQSAKRLPPPSAKPKNLSAAEMDSIGWASEIAWRMMGTEYQLTLDQMFCSLEFGTEFDRLVREFGPHEPSEINARWAAMTLRKRAAKSRKLAAQKYAEWTHPDREMHDVSIEDCLDADFEIPGVYLVYSDQVVLYVGETKNIRHRIEAVLANPSWQELEPTAVAFVPDSSNDRHGLQSAVAQRMNPLLNCRLLQFDDELPSRPLATEHQLEFAFDDGS